MKVKPQVLILSTQEGDWQQLLINGELIDEGHKLNGHDVWRVGNEYGFGPDDIRYRTLDDQDEEIAMETGTIPEGIFKKYYND